MSKMDLNNILNEISDSTATAGSSMDQRIEPVAPEMPMADAPIILSQPIASTRASHSNNKPASIQTGNGNHTKFPAQPSPHAPKQSSKLSKPPQVFQEEIITTLDPVDLDCNEHIIPLSLPGRVYEQYLEVINQCTTQHSKLMTFLKPDAQAIRAMERMIVELDEVVTHPDLLDMTSSEATIDEHGNDMIYGRAASFKLACLSELLTNLHNAITSEIPLALSESISSTELKVAVVVRNGKLLAILKKFLFSMNIAFTIADEEESYHEDKRDNLNLLLVSSDFKELDQLSSVDIIFAFDSSFNRSGDLVKTLKANGDKKTLVLFPWVLNSVEHVRACLPVVEGHLDGLRLLSQVLIQTREELGKLSAADRAWKSAASEVASWILDGFSGSFPLPELDPITFTGLSLILRPRNKRQLDEDNEEEGSSSPFKRRRTSDEAANETSQDDEMAALREQVTVLKSRVRLQEDKSVEQTNETAMLKANLETEIKNNYDLMNRCDKALNQSGRARKKLHELTIEKESSEASLASKSVILDKTKANLEEARARNKELENTKAPIPVNGAEGSLPVDTAEFLLLRTELEAQQKKVKSLTKKAESSEESRAYAFKLYQEASSRATELAGEVNEKQYEIDRLIPLAQNQSLIALQEAENSELETTKFALERCLAEKDELEEQLRRGNARAGMSTRGQSSAPGSSRSPRVAVSPPPPRSRASSRQPGAGSRATSPTGRIMGQGTIRRGLPGRLAEP